MPISERETNAGSRRPSVFSEAALYEARRIQVTPELLSKRPEVNGITIGPNMDRAFWCEKVGTGYKVTVSFADVASLLPVGSTPSALDNEAYAIGFAGKRKPLLPPALTGGLLHLEEGLPPERMRPTISVTIPLDEDFTMGEPEAPQLTKMSVLKNLTLRGADAILFDQTDPSHTFLKETALVAANLLERRRKDGALAFYDIDRKAATTEEGFVRPLKESELFLSAVIAQEFTFLANKALAEYLSYHDIPILYRNHRAKQAAPSSETLQEDIASVIASPELFNQDLLERRMQMTFERPRLSPVAQGHIGQNAALYGHFDPQSYDGIVNQRILAATIRGLESPYPFERLEVIGEHLNLVADVIRREDKESRKLQSPPVVPTGLTSSARQELLRGMEKGTFSKAIREFVSGDLQDTAVAEVIRERIRDGMVTANDMFRLLAIPTERNEIWQGIAEDVLTFLANNPHDAPTIASYGETAGLWTVLSPVRTNGKTIDESNFIAIQRIKIGEDEPITSSPRGADQSKRADQLAMVDLLGKIYGVSVDFPQEPVKEVTIVKPAGPEFRDGMDHVSLLNQWTQLNAWGPLQMDQISVAGPPNKRQFTMRGFVTIGRERFWSDEVEAGSKKEAKELIAENLNQKLLAARLAGEIRFKMQSSLKHTPAQAPRQAPGERRLTGTSGSTKKDRPVEVRNDDYRVAFHTWVSRQPNSSNPKYRVEELPDGGFSCTVRFTINQKKMEITRKGKYLDKNAAIQAVAQELFAEYTGQTNKI